MKQIFRLVVLILSFIFLFRLPVSAGEEEFYNVINQLRIDYQAYFMGFDSFTRVRDACHAAALQQGLAVMTQA